MKVDECVNRAVEHFVSSEAFKASSSESLTFDAKQMEDKVKAQEKETANLASTIVQLEAQMNDLVTKQKSLEALNDQVEQYTRRMNIRIFGIPETNKQEKTDELVKQFCKNELDVELKSEDISRSHRVGRVSLATAHRQRPIIVRLTWHNKKVEILKRRRQLRINKKPFSVQEDLTETCRSILNYLRDRDIGDVVSKAWTIDRVVFFRPVRDPSKITRCSTLEECQKEVAKYCYE